MATMIVTPGVLVPESIGFVQACVGLDAEPTQSIIITLQTVNAMAGALLSVKSCCFAYIACPCSPYTI